ncbi:metal-dependent hydrolase, partial [Methanocrinis sp.]|uniref:metal-dependent hydrolase n=1 Tax=Methanocrinis sp. TaxID=3101522 RepID=UPI003D0ED962
GRLGGTSFALLFVAIGSILPDLIDKPLGLLIYGSMATGRIFAHTLLFLLLLVAIAAILKSRAIGSLAFGVLAHQALDSIWRTPEIFLWPLLGGFPVNANMSVLGYFEMLIRGLERPDILVPELLGLLYLAAFGLQSWPATLAAARRIRRGLSKRGPSKNL